MKFLKFLGATAVAISLSATPAFAVNNSAKGSINQNTVVVEKAEKDPIKALERKKEKVQSLLKDGKITKEKADEMTARIDARIKDIQSFNKLTPQQKKDKLTNDFKARMDAKVKEGKLDRAKADSLLKDFNEKISKWDGKGYPQFHIKHHKDKKTG